MPLVALLKNNFSAGELSPQARALTDLARYRNGAAQLTNWQVLTTGGVTRRAGLRYLATAPGFCVLKPFEPSTTDAYILEFSHALLRFFKDTAYTGISLATAYGAGDLRALRSAQVNDVMILAHPAHAPTRLSRTAPTTFVFSAFPLPVPPTYEAGTDGAVDLTLSATTGAITVTAAGAAFFPSDVQRQLVSGVGRAILTGWTSSTVVSATVLDAFASTTIDTPATTWRLTGSPVAQLTPSAAAPVGAQITLTLGAEQPTATELLTQDFTTYTDYSGTVVLTSGTHLGANNTTNQLVDNANNFVARGVLTTHVVFNSTDLSRGIVSSVSPYQLGVTGLLFGGTDNDFDTGDAYQIIETGASTATAARAALNGGTAGHGWREHAVTTVVGVTYTLRFTIGEAPIAARVGSAAQADDVYAEASFPVGDQALQFTAVTTTSYIQFRNNQNVWGSVSQASVKVFTISGFRSTDVGRYVRIHGGLVLIRAVVDGATATGEILKELSSAAPAPAQAWSLEDPSWSAALGYPRAVLLYEGRLYFGGTARFPQTVWGSAVDSFGDFFTGTTPDAGVEFSVIESGGNITLNVISWLMAAENLLAGTSQGITRLVGAGDDPISPTSPPRARSNTHGTDMLVAPIKVDQALLYPSRQGAKLREINLDQVVTTRLQGRDLMALAGHLLNVYRLVELTHQPEPLSTVWGVRSDGTGLASTYDTVEQLNAWWRCVTVGAIESIAVIPHPTQNRHQVWMSVARTLGRFIEVLDPDAAMSSAAGAQWTGLTVDAGVVYHGAATATVTGLAHLENHTVQIVGDGVQYPDQVVQNGQVTGLVPPVTSAFVGLGFPVDGETLPPELVGAGTLQRSQKHWVELTAMVLDTVRLTVQAQPMVPQGVVPVSGDLPVLTLGWGRDGRVTFSAPAPFPATLLGLIGYLDLAQEQEG